MQEILVLLQKRADEDWIIGGDSRLLAQQAQACFERLTQLEYRPKILLAEAEPSQFLAYAIAAIASRCPVFFGNPQWGEAEWQQVFDLVQPNLVLGEAPSCTLFTPQPSSSHPAQIMIPTGGSSGKIRFAIHTWETLKASVQGFTQYFGKKPIHSYCVLPLYHVSGFMQFLRSLTTNGQLVIQSYKTIDSEFNPTDFFISLVPTQLQQLLQTPLTSWLARFHTVLLGGAPAWDELLVTARNHKIPLAPTYGMTETASQVVTLKPEDFLQGNQSCGCVLPHARVRICNEQNEDLAANQIGLITIESGSLMLGYYGQNSIQNLQSDDLGFFDEAGYLHVVGRCSDKIITGGENVYPKEVESAILSTPWVQDVCVLGLADTHWGQVVTAVYVPTHPEVSVEVLKAAIAPKLSKYKHPKYWLAVASLPRNLQGKVNRESIGKIARSHFNL